MALTKVDVANVVTGILPVANGGTGTSTGVAPGGSTTQVQYNNAGAFGGSSNFVFDGTNVGIGTSSPLSQLNVYKATTGGNIRISSNTDTAYGELIFSSSNATYAAYGASISSFGDGGGVDSGNLMFNTGQGGVRATKMTLTGTGNLGIGTSSPASPLDIQAANGQSMLRLAVTTGTNAVYSRYGNTGGYLYLGRDNSAGTDFGSAYAAGIWSTGAYPMLFGTNGTEKMRLDSSGNLGIGTSSPTPYNAGATLLQVNSGTVNAEVKITNSTTGTGATAGLAIVQSGTTSYFWNGSNGSIGFGTNNTQQATITSAGLFQFNSGYGSVATAYAPRAWVNFNGTGTVAIRASGNVSSITDNATGDYTVNFSTAMPDANYAIGSIKRVATRASFNDTILQCIDETNTSSAVRVQTINTGSGNKDLSVVDVIIFR